MDEQTKRLVCRMVAGLVASDEDFADAERAFLDKVLAQFGIPEHEWDAIFPLVDPEEAAQTMRSLDAMTQKEAFELLLEGAMADGKVVDEERAYLKLIGNAIGLDDSAVSDRLKAF
jgi:uncharacterized tellurite resistance protein B-like protein